MERTNTLPELVQSFAVNCEMMLMMETHAQVVVFGSLSALDSIDDAAEQPVIFFCPVFEWQFVAAASAIRARNVHCDCTYLLLEKLCSYKREEELDMPVPKHLIRVIRERAGPMQICRR